MKRKIYSYVMIVLPAAVSIMAASEEFGYLSGHNIFINPVLCFLIGIAGGGTAAVNLIRLKRGQGKL